MTIGQQRYAPEPGQSFGVQAARFSLYAPLVAIVINCAGINNKDLTMTIVIGVVNLILILAGFFLGIAALISIRRYGSKGILGRAIGGVCLNGLFLLAGLIALMPILERNRLAAKLPGHWRLVSSTATTSVSNVDLIFNPDGTFQMKGPPEKPLDVNGHWTFTLWRILGIHLDHIVIGDPSVVGHDIALGRVESIDDQHFTLKTDQGTEKYDRVP